MLKACSKLVPCVLPSRSKSFVFRRVLACPSAWLRVSCVHPPCVFQASFVHVFFACSVRVLRVFCACSVRVPCVLRVVFLLRTVRVPYMCSTRVQCAFRACSVPFHVSRVPFMFLHVPLQGCAYRACVLRACSRRAPCMSLAHVLRVFCACSACSPCPFQVQGSMCPSIYVYAAIYPSIYQCIYRSISLCIYRS